jgi:hypothetical protein
MRERSGRVSVGHKYSLVTDLIEGVHGQCGKRGRIDYNNIVLRL